MEEKYYSIRQTSNLLRIKVRTAREWLRSGKIKAMKDESSGRWKVPESEIMRLTNANKS